MEKEFNLSERLKAIWDNVDVEDTIWMSCTLKDAIELEFVEFIKRLKEEYIEKHWLHGDKDGCDWIDKLAGEDLI